MLSSILPDLWQLTREILGNTPEVDWLCLVPQELKKFFFLTSSYPHVCLNAYISGAVQLSA